MMTTGACKLLRRHVMMKGKSVVLVLLVKISHGFNIHPSFRRAIFTSAAESTFIRSNRFHAQQNEEDAGGENSDRINGDPESLYRTSKRCPDFPAFAFEAGSKKDVGSGNSKAKVRVVRRKDDDDALSSVDTSSWAYKVATEMPVEPGLFLDVANSARRTRLLKSRSYASPSAFAQANITCPPSLADLDRDPPPKSETFWISSPARLLSLVGSIWAFPSIIQALDKFVTLEPAKLNEIASTFGPGISIIYGTFVSLTLSVLYNRQQYIQDDVAQEAALLTVICRNLLTLFGNDRDKAMAVESAQTVADQIRILVKGSRGAELTLLMYSDPYSRMLELVAMKECQLMSERNGGDLGGQGNVLASCRDLINQLFKIRAKRLSDESLALSPTHYFVLTTLTMLILLGYCIATLPTVGPDGVPSFESSVLFGVLFTVYVFFYSFTNDLNNPFSGVYEIRRSSAASHLLEIKWLLANHPRIRGQVDFEEVQEGSDGNVRIRSPGIGDLWFEKEDIYVS